MICEGRYGRKHIFRFPELFMACDIFILSQMSSYVLEVAILLIIVVSFTGELAEGFERLRPIGFEQTRSDIFISY